MPFALVTVGILLIVVGFQDSYKQFGAQVQSDFTGQGSFIYWVVSILVIGGFGYVKEFQTASRAFLGLVIIALFLSKKSGTAQGITFFSNLVSGLNSGSTAQVSSPGTALEGAPTSSSSSGSTSSGSNGILSDVGTAASIAAFL